MLKSILSALFVGMFASQVAFGKPSENSDEGKTKRSAASVAASKSSKGTRKPQNNGIEIMPLDPDVPLDEMERAGYTINNGEKRAAVFPSEILSAERRDALLAQAGLSQYLGRLDEFEKDILLMRARRYSNAELSLKYKSLPRSGLLKLQHLLKQRGQK